MTGLNRLVRLWSCKKAWAGALLSVKCCSFAQKPASEGDDDEEEEDEEEEEEEEEEDFGCLATFAPLGVLFISENTWRWMVGY